MNQSPWQQRLTAALKSAGKSKRQVSLDSGNGPGYVHSILSEGKDPTITNLMDVCAAVPVSPLHIIHGLDITPAQEAVLSALEDNPDMAQSIINLLGGSKSEP